MTNRRDFLKQASILVAGGVVGGSILSSCGGGTPKVKKHIGLQLWSLKDDVSDLGIQKVLEIVAQMGYTHVETAGYNDGKIYNQDPSDFKKMVDDLGIRATSAHMVREISNDPDEDRAWWNKAIEVHIAAGFKYIVMPWAPFKGEGATLDNAKRYGEYFSNIGMMSAAAGISFGYHNHEFELEDKIDGVPFLDVLKENTSRQVFFQNDVYWTKVGGYDPVEYMKKHADRIKTLHIKDVKAIGASGTMDFEAIFNQAYAIGIKDWYVEVEAYDGTPQEDVKKSFDFLNVADYVK